MAKESEESHTDSGSAVGDSSRCGASSRSESDGDSTGIGLQPTQREDAIRQEEYAQGKSKESFMELIVPSETRHFRECTVEVENARGAKMKIHFQNVEMHDLGARIQRFWSESR
jgi:hypothetical protein